MGRRKSELSRNLPEYVSWQTMTQRCYNFNHANYQYGGEKGLGVCDEWRYSFELFYKDVGPRPENKPFLMLIDRNKNYVPGNVKWATRTEVNRALTNVKLSMNLATAIRADYQTGMYSYKALGEEYHVSASTIAYVVKNEIWKEQKCTKI